MPYDHSMRGRREKIQLASGQSFRLLRWEKNLREVDSLQPSGRVTRIRGEGMDWHYHVDMELTLFTLGQGTRFVGDHIAPFAAGEVVLLGENLPHHWHTLGPSSGLSAQWRFPDGHPFWAFPETFAFRELFQAAGRGIRYTGDTASAIRECLEAMGPACGPERLGLLLRLLARTTAAPENERSFLSAKAFSLPDTLHHGQAVSNAVRYLLANFRDQIRLEELLRLTGMSKPTFARQFRRLSGKTFSDFLTHIRLQTACRALKESDRPVIEIALASGFRHVSFFNRMFRRHLRCNPTQYRRRCRKRAPASQRPPAARKNTQSSGGTHSSPPS